MFVWFPVLHKTVYKYPLTFCPVKFQNSSHLFGSGIFFFYFPILNLSVSEPWRHACHILRGEK